MIWQVVDILSLISRNILNLNSRVFRYVHTFETNA